MHRHDRTANYKFLRDAGHLRAESLFKFNVGDVARQSTFILSCSACSQPGPDSQPEELQRQSSGGPREPPA